MNPGKRYPNEKNDSCDNEGKDLPQVSQEEDKLIGDDRELADAGNLGKDLGEENKDRTDIQED